MDTLGRLAAPAGAKFRQLQKIVQDIRKNDGGILDKLRRLKNKSTPKVPAKDYQEHDIDGEDQWSDAEFESDTYEDPQDDSYEPPPSHLHYKPTAPVPFLRGEYLDSGHNRPSHPPRKPLRPPKTTKPLPPTPILIADDDEDYINPDSDNNDDNYIDPTEKHPPSPRMHGRNRVLQTSSLASKPVSLRSHIPGVYEVPSHEDESPSRSRLLPVSRPPQSLPPPVSPRMNIRKPSLPVQGPRETDSDREDDDDEYEVCDPDDGSNMGKNSVPVVPRPRPREKPPKPTVWPKPDLKPNECEGQALPTRPSSQKPTARKLISTMAPLTQMFSLPRQTDRGSGPNTSQSADKEQDTDLSLKLWYASDCDRKTAEDALIQSNKDGSFLVRQSSGQDTQQPYTLVVFYNSHVYNIPVRYIQTAQQYALGKEKTGEERFSSVSQMIENHQRNPLVLIDSQSNAKDTTKLRYPVRP